MKKNYKLEMNKMAINKLTLTTHKNLPQLIRSIVFSTPKERRRKNKEQKERERMKIFTTTSLELLT